MRPFTSPSGILDSSTSGSLREPGCRSGSTQTPEREVLDVAKSRRPQQDLDLVGLVFASVSLRSPCAKGEIVNAVTLSAFVQTPTAPAP